MCTEITKRHLNNRICLQCGVKTSTVTPSFYYVFNISLSCENSMPSFIGNLWRFFYWGITLTKTREFSNTVHNILTDSIRAKSLCKETSLSTDNVYKTQQTECHKSQCTILKYFRILFWAQHCWLQGPLS